MTEDDRIKALEAEVARLREQINQLLDKRMDAAVRRRRSIEREIGLR